MKKDLKETVLCAAIWFPDIELNHPCQCTNINKGTVMCGFRHGNIVAQFTALTGSRIPLHNHIQGFITNKNRFFDRKEAHKLFIETGNNPEFKDELYSEDLY